MLGVYISRVLFILIYGFIVFYLFKNRKELAPFHIINSFYFSFLAFILFALTWLMPWYLLILIFLAIILFAQTKQKKYLYSGYVFLFYAIIFYIFLR